MKRITTPPPPASFLDWVADNPKATWEELKRENREAADEVRRRLVEAQHHLCAYCEIDLQAPLFAQVEHWFPKDPQRDSTHNWGLDFSNFMAACEGGTRPDVDPKGRRTLEPIKETQHCGQKKGNQVRVDEMLDPRSQIPSGPVWDVDPKGQIHPRAGLPPAVATRAEATIRHLNLRSRVLNRLRLEHWKAIESSVSASWEDLGADDDAYATALSMTVEMWLGPQDGRLPNFWSTARAYYGPTAEAWLVDHPEVMP